MSAERQVEGIGTWLLSSLEWIYLECIRLHDMDLMNWILDIKWTLPGKHEHSIHQHRGVLSDKHVLQSG